jgi:hypothetical protein
MKAFHLYSCAISRIHAQIALDRNWKKDGTEHETLCKCISVNNNEQDRTLSSTLRPPRYFNPMEASFRLRYESVLTSGDELFNLGTKD